MTVKIDRYYETNIRPLDREFMKMFGMYRRHLAFLTPASRVLEIGPGNGGFSVYIRERYGIPSDNFTLADLSESVVRTLRAQPETRGFRIELADIIDLLERDETRYDLIIMRHVLEHFEKSAIDRLMPLLEKRLSDSGRLLVEVPNLANALFGSYMAYGDYSHYTHFADKSLRECVTWNTEACEAVCHNSVYNFFWTANLKLMAVFFAGKLVELFSALLSLPTFAYGNRVFTPRLVAVVTHRKHG